MTAEIPIACDMTTASDTAAGRLAEYRELFGDWLTGRERRGDGGIRFRFGAGPGVERRVRDLAAREQACCPFFRFQVAVADGEVRWDAAVADGEPARQVLEEFYNLPDTVRQDTSAVRDRFTRAGLTILAADGRGGRRPASDADLGLAR